MELKQTILVVEDTVANVDILLELLSDYDVLVALDGEAALEIAANEPIDLILLDIVMPILDGYQTCLKLKDKEQTKDIPIIFITAKEDEESIEKAYEYGGLDYVTKPFKPKELLARVKTQLKIRALITHLEKLSSFDCMTEVFNRRMFFEKAQQRVENLDGDLYAMMFDIDKFKAINDNYGHSDGDLVIQKVASILQNRIPDHGVLGRIGGEEFAVVLHAQSLTSIQELTEQIRQEISHSEVTSSQGEPIRFTISIGFAKYTPNITELDELLRHADVALYEAKMSGRNKVVMSNL